MLIYAPGMKPQTVDEPVYSADLLPTLLNLLDLPYDARPLSGRDIFSSTPPLVPFSDRSFITDRGQYDSWTRKFTPFSPFEEDGYVTRTLETVNAKFSAAARILDYDFLNG